MSKSRVAERSAAYALKTAVEPACVSSFDLLATAPNGMTRLRELIISMAVSGQLSAENRREEKTPLVPRVVINSSSNPHVTSSTRKAALSPVSENETPNKLPSSWRWERLGSLAHMENGDRGPNYPSKSAFVDNGIAFINAGHLKDGRVDLQSMNFITASRFDLLRSGKVRPGDVLFCLRGSLGKVALVESIQVGAIASSLIIVRFRSEMRCRFGLLYFSSPQVRAFIAAANNGTAQPNLAGADLASFPVPVPPLAEQARIVARVEELMQLCDALEAHGRLQEEQHARLVATLFDALAASASAEELAENWQRIATHFDLLLDRPEAVDTLEQILLQLAIRGLLVPQNPADEPAGALLARIRAEKNRLIAKGRLKRDKPIEPVSDELAPFDVRSGWECVPFGELVNISSGITLGRKTTPSKPVTLPYLRVANVQRWHLDLDDLKTITVGEDELPRFLLQRGDLLLTEGGDWDKVGRTCIWQGAVEQCLHQNHVFKARGVLPEWSPAWAELYLNSAYARTYFAGASKQTTNLASINSTQLKSCPFPLPPVAEQHRIVARVEQLRRLCADLRERLQQSRATQSRLADTLVRQVAGS